jgi:hypothetical protein
LAALGIDCTGRDEDMDMGVVVESSRVSVQDRASAEVATKLWVMLSELLQGRHRGLEQHGVHGLWFSVGQRSQLCGQGEGHHEVRHWQQSGLLPCQPGTGTVMLTSRTTAMAAGTVPNLIASTVIAVHKGAAEGAGSTLFYV